LFVKLIVLDQSRNLFFLNALVRSPPSDSDSSSFSVGADILVKLSKTSLLRLSVFLLRTAGCKSLIRTKLLLFGVLLLLPAFFTSFFRSPMLSFVFDEDFRDEWARRGDGFRLLHSLPFDLRSSPPKMPKLTYGRSVLASSIGLAVVKVTCCLFSGFFTSSSSAGSSCSMVTVRGPSASASSTSDSSYLDDMSSLHRSTYGVTIFG
jgi:hypothetical protein